MPTVGDRVRVRYRQARPRDGTVDARRPGRVTWRDYAAIWLVVTGVFGTMAYRDRTRGTRARDGALRRSPDDAPPLGR
ncbi:hypothetical protein ACIBI3_41810 [Actinomadura luteofluorescens]|uniref:hypothetical protein n=1 Tax=Actinomadura luteofluorescens TaxID=46163 RepID=UPI003488BF5F